MIVDEKIACCCSDIEPVTCVVQLSMPRLKHTYSENLPCRSKASGLSLIPLRTVVGGSKGAMSRNEKSGHEYSS